MAVAGCIGCGSAFDPPGKQGATCMTMQLLSEGTVLHDKLELAAMLEDNGMALTFAAERERSDFAGRCLSEDLPLLLGILAEELRQPGFPPEGVERVRVHTLNSLRRSADDTFDRAYNRGRALLYGGDQPYGWPTLGTEQAVQSLTREDLLGFCRDNVVPARILLAIVGDIDSAATADLVSKLFGDWKVPGGDDAAIYASADNTLPLGKATEIVTMPDRSNATVLIMRRGIKRNEEDYYAVMVANYLFGGDFLARLNERLRVREGFTYGSYSFLNAGRGRGAWTLYIQVNPANAKQASEIALEEWHRMHTEGISEEELQKAKSYLTGNFAVQLNNIGAIASALAEIAYHNLGLDYVERYPRIVNSLTREQVDSAFRKHLSPEDYVIVAAGSINDQ
ncbi:MAG: hypothetical protein A2Y63_05145 [Candidatus Riflebacteria bacterium RBG_13_59_9]|nr:MAG: hypothetical protein A2Y63_05145 [Candidatus Riflebacteria bacterium RBG_13_59_9]